MRSRAAGTTAVGGAALYAAKRGASAGREEQPNEGAAPDPASDSVDRLKELAELHEQGILTEEEFAAEKKKLLEI